MSRERIDRGAVLATLDIVQVIERYIELKKDGTEFVACCPFHDEKSPSFKVNEAKQIFYCFGCAMGGDAIKFVTEYENIGFLDAIKKLTGKEFAAADGVAPEKKRLERVETPEWQVIMPVPDNAPAPSFKFRKEIDGVWTEYPVQMVHPYRNQEGALLGYVVRLINPATGKKEPTPRTYCVNTQTGECEWRWLSFPKPRPLYGLDDLAAKPAMPVLLVEGEKCQEAARRLMPKLACVAWPGGGKAVGHVDWSPLSGRKVMLWRDADIPGYVTMYGEADETGELIRPGIAHLLAKAGALAVKCVEPPDGVADGYDIADAEADGWQQEDTGAYIKSHARDPLPPYCKSAQQEEPDTVVDELPFVHEIPDSFDDGSNEVKDSLSTVIRCLGHQHGVYYYYSRSARQVIDLAASEHSKNNLYSMAPKDDWDKRFPAKGGMELDFAVNALMRKCEAAGIYDPDRIRGRGAWWDSGRAVLHLGDHIVVDGERKELEDVAGRFIYEAATPMQANIDDPLTPKEAHQLLEICKMLQWEKPFDAYMLAGWIMLAPICGAMDWRPHIWITGGAGTGKSWAMFHILTRCLGKFALKAVSSSTEAGIRQSLGHDARVVVFDEAEGEDAAAQARIQMVMQLMRQASSESGGEILKGSTGGRAMSFKIRSAFAFSSIGVGVHQYADKTRVSVLQLRVDQSKTPQQRENQFETLKEAVHTVLTDAFVARLHARAIRLISVIRHNAKIFSVAGARVIGQQRLGDQIGALLAGAYALHSNKTISIEEAQSWIEQQDWSEETGLNDQKDEMACLSRILEYVIRVSGFNCSCERSVAELVNIGANRAPDNEVTDVNARQTLIRYGIRVADDKSSIGISNTHTALDKILRDSPWSTGWGRILKRIPGAAAMEPARMGNAGTTRGTLIPLSVIN